MKKIESEIVVLYETAHAELGSALEMLAACKETKKPNLAYGYFMHAKDEYNHAKSFFKMLGSRCGQSAINTARKFRFTPPSLLSKGYISSKGF